MLVKILNIEIFIPEDGPIVVKCSGGADSTILLFILMQHVRYPIHVVTGAFKTKQRATVKTTPIVIDRCIELTGNSNVVQHIIFCEEEEQKYINDFAQSLITKNNCKLIYSATTSYPPDDVTSNFINKTGSKITYSDRNPNIIKPSEIYGIYRPFINIDKRKIKDLYEYFELLDTLFPLTRSCESYEISSGHCGKCWWCEERFWAFGKYS